MKRESALEQASAAWEDSLARPAVFDLLGESPSDVYDEYVTDCLLDVQLLCDLSWERGEIGPSGAQALLPFGVKE